MVYRKCHIAMWLNTVKLQSLKCFRLAGDLILCCKLLHDYFDSSITTTLNLCRNLTRGHCQNVYTLLMLVTYILPIELWIYGTVYLTLLLPHHQLLFLERDCSV